MAGIWKPYNHSCLLDGEGKYEGLDYDYPSLSEVDYLLSKADSYLEKQNNAKLFSDEGQFQVVFGVTSTTLPLYEMFVREKVISNAAAGDIGRNGKSSYFTVSHSLSSSLQVNP